MAKKKIKHGREGGKLPTVERGGTLHTSAEDAGLPLVIPIDTPEPEDLATLVVTDADKASGRRGSLRLTEAGKKKEAEYNEKHEAAKKEYLDHKATHGPGESCDTCKTLSDTKDTAYAALNNFRRSATGDKAMSKFEKTGELPGTKVADSELSDETLLQKHISNMKAAAAAGNHVEADQHKLAALMTMHLSGVSEFSGGWEKDPIKYPPKEGAKPGDPGWSEGSSAVEMPCSTTNCHGTHFNDTSVTGLCSDCAAHEEENGWGSAETRIPRRPGSNLFNQLNDSLGNSRQSILTDKLIGAFKVDTTPPSGDDWAK